MGKQKGYGGGGCVWSLYLPALTFLEIFLHLRQEQGADSP